LIVFEVNYKLMLRRFFYYD